MPILDIQKRFRELGRIRTGEVIETGGTYQSGPRKGQKKTRPSKLPRFRLTSPWAHLIEHAAETFGGTPRPWHNDGTGGDEFEVYVEVDSLPVIIPPGEFFEQWYELWTGGGCEKRCDGERQVLKDAKCSCPADPIARQELAAKGKACKPTTRVRLMLPDVEDVGIWRLESHGFHAAAELGGAAGLVEAAVRLGTMIPADLRLQAREGARRPGEPRKSFYVPAITFRGTLGPVLDALGVLEAGSVMPALVGMEPRPALDTGGRPELPPGGTTFDPAPVDRASFPEPLPTPEPGGSGDVDVDPGETIAPPAGDFAPPDPGEADQGSGSIEPGSFDPPDRPADDGSESGGGRGMTGPQMVAIKTKDRGIEDRAEKLAFCSAVVDRKLSSSKELKPAEVRRILDVLSDDALFTEYAGKAFEYLDDESESAEDGVDVTTATSSSSSSSPPAPIETTARETRRPAQSSRPDPSAMSGDDWRELLKTKGVKVTALLREAARLAREAGGKAPGTLDDVAASGLAEDLLGFVEAETAS